jgi:hypothetical protein
MENRNDKSKELPEHIERDVQRILEIVQCVKREAPFDSFDVVFKAVMQITYPAYRPE